MRRPLPVSRAVQGGGKYGGSKILLYGQTGKGKIMRDTENKEAGKWFEWWYRNQNAWELVCGEHLFRQEFTMRDAVQISKELVDREMYQLAIVMLHQFLKSSCIDEAFIRVIVGRLEGNSPEMGIISECIASVERVLLENHAMDNKVIL